MEEVVESLRGDPTGSGLPKDGTVAEITSNILVLVSHLSDHKETLATVLCKPPYSGGQPGQALAIYISELNIIIFRYKRYDVPKQRIIEILVCMFTYLL